MIFNHDYVWAEGQAMDINPYQSPAHFAEPAPPPGRPPAWGMLARSTVEVLVAIVPTFAAVTLLICLPWEIAVAYVGYFIDTEENPFPSTLMTMTASVSTLLLAEGIVIAATRLHLRREPGGVVRAAVIALQSFPKLFLWVLASGFVINLGAIFCFLPGIYLNIRWMFVSASVLFDPQEQPMNRSWQLTQQHIGFASLLFLGLAIPMVAVILLPLIVLDFLPPEDWVWLLSIVGSLIGDVAILVVTVAFACAFHHLREMERAHDESTV